MKVAVTFDKGRVFQHFGKTKEFKIYEIKDNKVTDFYYITINSGGCASIVPILKANGVNALICGGLGEGAYNNLIASNIIVLSGVEGEVDDVIGEFINETLKYDEKPNCHHDDDGDCCH